MKLIAKCSSCKEQMKVPGFMMDTRINLARKIGKEFDLRCEKCGQTNHLHVDDVKAVDGSLVKLVGIISVVVALVLIVVFWELGFIAYASLGIPVLLIASVQKTQSSRIRQFNLMHYDSKRNNR